MVLVIHSAASAMTGSSVPEPDRGVVAVLVQAHGEVGDLEQAPEGLLGCLGEVERQVGLDVKFHHHIVTSAGSGSGRVAECGCGWPHVTAKTGHGGRWPRVWNGGEVALTHRLKRHLGHLLRNGRSVGAPDPTHRCAERCCASLRPASTDWPKFWSFDDQ